MKQSGGFKMKANELRIGNFVGRKYLNPNPNGITHEIEPCMVKSIKEDFINVTLSFKDKCISKINISSIEPIQLTEEWLVKFGFKDVQRGFYSIKAGSTFFRLTPPQFMGEWQTEYCWVYDDFKFTEVKYVHQLQNLYFALTGEELTIKDNGSE